MLLAYIDEIGEPGAFVAPDHPRFNTSPAFGYAGFVLPAASARAFGAEFTREKRRLFRTEYEAAGSPGQWERKGASVFRPDTPERFPQHLRVFGALVRRLRTLGGHLFYYADEKPIGTPKQTALERGEREQAAMRETLNRLCTHADAARLNLLVMIDQINERQRSERLPNMYGHILGRAAERQEMKRIVEPPMHIDSILSSNIQFADWVAAAVSRALDYQLLASSRYAWVPDRFESLAGSFTHESKLHLFHRSIEDLHHSEILRRQRPLHPRVLGHRIGSDPQLAAKLKQVALSAERARRR